MGTERRKNSKIEKPKYSESESPVSFVNLQKILDSIPIATQIYDTNGLLIYTNMANDTLFNVDKSTNLVNKFNVTTNDVTIDSGLSQAFKKALDGHTTRTGNYKFDPEKLGFTGPQKNIKSLIYPVVNLVNVVEYVAIVNEDISKELEVEKTLRIHEIRLESFEKNINEVLYRVNVKKRIFEYIGSAILEISGLTSEEYYKSPEVALDFVHPDWKESFKNLWENLYDGNIIQNAEYQIISKSGEHKWIYQTSFLLIDNEGIPFAVEGTISDITEKKRHELIQHVLGKISEAATISDDLNELTKIIHDELGALLDTTNFYVAIYHPEENVFSFPFHKDKYDPSSTLEAEEGSGSMTEYVFRTGKPLLADREMQNKIFDGIVDQAVVGEDAAIWLGAPLITPNGPIGVVAVQSYEDRTLYTQNDLEVLSIVASQIATVIERKRAEDKLRESEEKFRSIAENTPGVFYMYDIMPNGDRISLYNGPGLAKLIGPKFAKLVSSDVKAFFNLVPEEDKAIIIEASNEASKQNIPLDVNYRMLTDSGNYIWIRSISDSIDIGDGINRVQGVIVDINEQKLAEVALKESLDIIDSFLDSATDAFSVWNSDFDLTLHNKLLPIMYCLDESLNDHIGVNIAEFTPGFKDALENQDFSDVVESGEPFFFDETVVSKDNQEKYLSHKIFRVGNGLGVVTTDISERVLAEDERKKLENRFQEAQRMESLSILAGGIAHDFNNLLAGILGNAELILVDSTIERTTQDSVKRIRDAAERAAELTRQMLAYSGKGKFIIKTFNLSDLVQEMANLVKSTISKKAEVLFNLNDAIPPMEGDATQIRQLIMNLLINASDALEMHSGNISISTGTVELDKQTFDKTYFGEECAVGTYAYLEVSDTGCGMNEETLGKIFDPFFTTKFTGRGLGLAATLGIIRGHNGTLKVDSAEGIGTTFKIYFPIVEGGVITEPEKTGNGNSANSSETILVVDDEDYIRHITVSMLERSGYSTMVAVDGEDAVRVFKENSESIDAILLDLSMPRMSGFEVFEIVREINPFINIVIVSGFSEQESSNVFSGQNRVSFLQKPFRLNSLLMKLSEIFDM
jgi:two-component system, cell cycle sensor histidine kinase and response regulator CckA